MTPRQLLESVKNRFVVLLHDEPAKLDALLMQAIGEYQDRAGFIANLGINEEEQKVGGVPVPCSLFAVSRGAGFRGRLSGGGRNQ